MSRRVLRPALLPMLAMVLAAAACSSSAKRAGESDPSADPGQTLAAPDAPQAPIFGDLGAPTDDASSAGDASSGRSISVQNDLYQFGYSYPAAAGALPGLKAMLDADAAQQQGRTRRNAQANKDDMDKGGFPYHTNTRQMDWQVVADIPGWLSLSGKGYTFTGGAHGNTWFATILWDKQANAQRKPLDLFTSQAALSQAITTPFCAALDRQRAQKRGTAPAPATSGSGQIDEFNRCIDPTAETIILGSSNGQTFDRIGVLVPPYEAGPYVEGTYEVTLPVTDAVMAALKPQYRASFTVAP